MPGSFVGASGAANDLDELNPVVNADDEYRS